MAVTTTQEGAILRLRLARPEKKNALDLGTLQSLGDAIAACADEHTTRAVLIEAEGDVFCAGGDVDVMRDFAGDWKATVDRLRGGLNRLVQAIQDAPVPVLCAVQGNAYGAGAVLAFQCDLTVAAEDAQFALSFRHVGLIPDTGGTWLLPRRLGMQRAKHLVWTGAPFDATQAQTWGLILRTAPRAQVQEHAIRLARALVDGPAATIALAKRAMQANQDVPLQSALEREARIQAAAFLTAEHAEGRDAFFGRHRPAWN